MSGSTTTPPAATRAVPVLNLVRLRKALREAAGRARGRSKWDDVLVALSGRRKTDAEDAELLLALEGASDVALTDGVAAALVGRLGVSQALLDAATDEPPAASAPAGAASGTVTVAAGGTATLAVPGTAVAANGVGWWADLSLMTRDPDAGTRGGVRVTLVVKREAADAAVAAVLDNRFGAMFGAAAGAGVAVTVAAACAADGSSVTVTLGNAAASPRGVAYAVRRVAG